jgi:hypothetical protein
MSTKISKAVNKFAALLAILPIYIVLIDIELNTIYGLIVAVVIPTVIVGILARLIGNSIKIAFESGEITKDELIQRLLKHPLVWVGASLSIILNFYLAFSNV